LNGWFIVHALSSQFPTIRLAAVLLLAAGAVHAQIDVSCTLEPDVALQFEPVKALVKLKNNTGTDIGFFGEDATAGLDFRITDSANNQVKSWPGAPVREPIYLAPAETVVVTNFLTSLYDLRKAGPYAVQARATWQSKSFAHEEKKYLDVVPGIELEKATAAVAGGTAMRTYSLRTVHRARAEHLLLRIDDAAGGMCYGVYDLGPFVRRREPAMTVDASGYVHILYQNAPTRFLHQAFAPDGTGSEPVSYLDETGRVHFETGTDGAVAVVGADPEVTMEDEEEE
jgi:hypothetical protein